MSNDHKHHHWDGHKLEGVWGDHAHRATIAIASSNEWATALLFDEGGFRAHYHVATDKVAAFIDLATRAWRGQGKAGSIAVVWSTDLVAAGIGPGGPPPPPPGPPGQEILPLAALAAHHQLLAFNELAFGAGLRNVK